jgi:asparagine synthase (glutamine-hydrolysing)
MSSPVKTFTIGFGVADHDETAYARTVAERYGTEHQESFIDPQSFAASDDMIDRLVDIYDEPFGDNSALPTLRVCAEARKKVTVALSGDGGDEAFGGYRRYLWHAREHAVRSLVPAAIRGPLFTALAALYPSFDNAPRFLRAGNTLRELAMDAASAYFNNVSPFSPATRASIYTPRFRRELQGYDAVSAIAGLMRDCPDDRPLVQAQYVDFHTWLPGRMLVKVDRASMAVGLEVRNPFLDHRFFQWAISLPAKLKLDGGNYKAILKTALEPSVPRDILYRPKQGFAMPIARWLRHEWREMLRCALNAPAVADRGILDLAVVNRLFDDHVSGRKDHSAVLWSLLVLARFLAA